MSFWKKKRKENKIDGVTVEIRPFLKREGRVG